MTTFVYSAHLALLIAGFVLAGPRPVLFILAAAMAGTWLSGAYLGGAGRIIAFMLIELCCIFAIAVWRDRKRDRLVGLVSLILICWAVSYTVIPHMDYATYATGVNSAAAVQLLIGGGMADDLGRRVDSWLSGHFPRGARLVRSVAV